MPSYSYTAKSLNGELHSGVSEASDEYALARILHDQGYILIKADLTGKSKKNKLDVSISFFGVNSQEKLFFTRNLRIMINAGVSLPKALETLASASKSKKFKDALLEVKNEVIRGKTFSEALEKFPSIFSELFCNMIKAGEEAGTMEDALEALTKQIDREVELKSKIKGAMMYPLVIVSAMIGIGILMLVMVVPQLAETFEGLDMELPATAQFIISFGNLLLERWYIFVLLFFVLLIIARMLLKSRKGGKGLDGLLLKVPVISSLVKKTNSALTARILSSLIFAGVPIVRCLEITSKSLGNFYYREALKAAAGKVRKGQKLSEVLADYSNIYPLTFVQMIKVGEETGETSEILEKVAGFYEREVADATKNLSSIIEPILMLIIGGAVGFFAISVVQPIYSMMGSM